MDKEPRSVAIHKLFHATASDDGNGQCVMMLMMLINYTGCLCGEKEHQYVRRKRCMVQFELRERCMFMTAVMCVVNIYVALMSACNVVTSKYMLRRCPSSAIDPYIWVLTLHIHIKICKTVK